MENPPVTAVAPPLHIPDFALPPPRVCRPPRVLASPSTRSCTAYAVAASEHAWFRLLICAMGLMTTESIVTGSFSLFGAGLISVPLYWHLEGEHPFSSA